MWAFYKYWNISTNILCTLGGEKYIPFWNLKKIGDLTICGLFYDEVVSSNEKLKGLNQSGKPYLPHSNTYIFLAFHKKPYKIDDHYKMKIIN